MPQCTAFCPDIEVQAAVDHVLDVVAVVGDSATLQDDEQSERVGHPRAFFTCLSLYVVCCVLPVIA
jgi:hypothetical protein